MSVLLKNLFDRAALSSGVASIFVLSYIFIQFTVDDSLITFRYAKNFVDSGVWNWNASPTDIVESYTNPLFAFLAIIPEVLGLNTIITFKISNIILLIFLLFRLLKEQNFILVFLFISTYGILYVHLYAGLETFLFVAVCLLAWLEMDKDDFTGSKLFLGCVLILPFIRPEGALFSLVLALYLVRLNIKFLIPTLIVCLIWIVYFWMRFSYFGELFPNTFYVKSSHALDGQNIASNFLSMKFYLIFLLYYFFICQENIVRSYITLVLVVLVFYCFSDLQMNYADRFAFQVTFPLIVISLIKYKFESFMRALIYFLLVLSLSLISLKSSYAVVVSQYSHTLLSLHELGESLRKFRGSGRLLISDAGILPYKSGWHTLDYIGLGNKTVAHVGYLSYQQLDAYRPHLLLISSDSSNRMINVVDGTVLSITKYLKNERIAYLGDIKWSDNYIYRVYVDKDYEYSGSVESAVSRAIASSSQLNMREGYHLLKDVMLFLFIKDELRFDE